MYTGRIIVNENHSSICSLFEKDQLETNIAYYKKEKWRNLLFHVGYFNK